jgi:hypothetical protein
VSRSSNAPVSCSESRTLAAAIFLDEAFDRSQRFDHRAVNREMIVRNQALPLRNAQHLREEMLCYRFAEQAVPIGAEGRLVPHRLVNAHPEKSAVQQIVFDMLHQLPLRADQKQRLNQTGAQQAFQCNRRPTMARIQRLKFRTHVLQNAIDQHAQFAGWPTGTRSSSER